MSDDINNISNEIKKNTKKLFFRKSKEWEHEQEYRIIKRCPIDYQENYYHFGNALKFIIISSKIRNIDEVLYFDKLNKLKDISSSLQIPLLVYGNGLYDYSLVVYSQEYQYDTIWNSKDGYNIIEPEADWELADDYNYLLYGKKYI